MVNCDLSNRLLILDMLFTKSDTDLLIVFWHAHEQYLDSFLSRWYGKFLQRWVRFVVVHWNNLFFFTCTLFRIVYFALRHYILVKTLQVCTHWPFHVFIGESDLKIMIGFSYPDVKVWLIRLERNAISNHWAKHHLRAVHEVIHHVLDPGQKCLQLRKQKRKLRTLLKKKQKKKKRKEKIQQLMKMENIFKL